MICVVEGFYFRSVFAEMVLCGGFLILDTDILNFKKIGVFIFQMKSSMELSDKTQSLCQRQLYILLSLERVICSAS